MSSETYESLSKFAGTRVKNDNRLEQTCEVIDELPCNDLLSLLTIASEKRSATVSTHDIMNGNRFHEPSLVSQRDFHWLEGVIMDSLDDNVDFVELSPLQPFGINKVLANTNQKNIVSTLRRSEANSDATTALFRVALQRFGSLLYGGDFVRIASNIRTVRAQTFDKNTKFLPHFKVFGEASVGKQNSQFGSRELDLLLEHLGTEVDIIDKLASSERSNISNIQIRLGNLALLEDLANRGRVNIDEARRNTISPDYNLINEQKIDIPEYISLATPAIGTALKAMGFKRGVKITEIVKQKIEEKRPDLIPRIQLHLGRIAGIGYYKHICYKIAASNNQDINIPIADGGTTGWATKVSQDKQLFSVVSGIGTELVCQYLITK
ncbi:MAG: hypothetical protein M1554_01755 [Patescibacteria group bacterium]|jgi:hypothetical protein|nr:hypothetical protein [Patescibacteria group bacterium]